MSSFRRVAHHLSILLLALALGAGAVWADSDGQSAAVGDDGTIYRAQAGAYGDLFAHRGLTDPSTPVLALEITPTNGATGTVIVPGTEGAEVEDSASVLFDNDSGAAFIVWQSRTNLIHSSLKITSYKDGDWSPVIEIWGSPFRWKSSPHLAVTRDVFNSVEADGSIKSWHRTLLHLIWAEEGTYGPHILYSPLVLIDGQYTGGSPIYELTQLVAPADETAPGTVDPQLAGSPQIQVGRNNQSVLISFADAETGLLDNLELEILPGEFSSLADEVESAVIDPPGQSTGIREDPQSLADRLGHQIIELGSRLGLHPGLTAYTAAVIEDAARSSSSDEDIQALGRRLGHQIIEIGARMTGRDRGGIARAKAVSHEIMIETGSGPDIAAPTNVIRATTMFSRPMPEIDAARDSVVLQPSTDGEELTVAWTQGDRVVYRESRQYGWTDRYEIALGRAGVTTLDEALSLLQRRAESR